MSSSTTAGDRNLPSNENEVYILVIVEDTGASETDHQILNQPPPPPPVEVFTIMVSNVLEWSASEKIIEDGALSSIGVEKRFLSVTNL